MIDEIPGAVIARPESGSDYPPSVFSNDTTASEQIPTDQSLSLVYPEERRTTFISLVVDSSVTSITVEYPLPGSNFSVSRFIWKQFFIKPLVIVFPMCYCWTGHLNVVIMHFVFYTLLQT